MFKKSRITARGTEIIIEKLRLKRGVLISLVTANQRNGYITKSDYPKKYNDGAIYVVNKRFNTRLLDIGYVLVSEDFKAWRIERLTPDTIPKWAISPKKFANGPEGRRVRVNEVRIKAGLKPYAIR
ncbi:hypothetical protein JK628_23125 (plasmid) [Shewanella sp. KX20019]|uniref:hypothetical protein n=1 Tax=Shewanella sp. KX20019 TaxID=2803864 RepID=UPI0019297079|nr:hypothetical protein [Shewanella sp. KX20019]QQX82707.1 hypothetical protein JK628_23125 [Shewanella sp. KX20019]